MADPETARKPRGMTARSARQGRLGRPVLVVLVLGIVLLLAGYAVLGLINAGEDMAGLGSVETNRTASSD